jgi:hypothetical protein
VAVARIVLSGLAAILIALLGPGFVIALRGMSHQRATGLAAIAGGLTGAILSPLFWILAAVLFGLFFAACRLSSKLLRVIFFWIPTVAVSTLGLALLSLFAYAWLHFR